MKQLNSNTIKASDASWPLPLTDRLGASAPPAIQVVGPPELLIESKTAFFCSVQTPGTIILRAHDTAKHIRDKGVTAISGFHSSIEKDCLRILLRGKQPIIICPARAIETMRIPSECRAAFEEGRILFISPFVEKPKRVTRDSAIRRNEIVAALADEAYIAHVTAGSETERILGLLKAWRVPTQVDSSDIT